MKFKSQIVTEASGSVGGLTYSHNRGGLYTRARAVPTNPNSTQQQVIRGYMSQLSNLWVSTLTPAQRAAWDTYAEQVPIADTLGEPRNIGGLAMYCRCNVFRLQGGLPRVDAGPTTFTVGEYTLPTLASLSAATQQFSLVFEATDAWVGEDDAAMQIYTSRPQNPSINYFKGPYRYADQILGDSTTPPTSPATMDVAFPFVAGQRVFVRVNVTRADGRLGTEWRGFLLAGA